MLAPAGGMTDEKKAARTRALAAWVRERILQLGPTFIKLGQLFSTRSDIFPAEFTQELSKLQVWLGHHIQCWAGLGEVGRTGQRTPLLRSAGRHWAEQSRAGQ